MRLYLRRTDALPRKLDEQDPSTGSPKRPATILVVDDDPDVRAFLTESLDSLGYDAVMVDGGGAALKTLEQIIPASHDPRLRDARNERRRGGQADQGAAARPADHLRQRLFGDAAVSSVQGERSRVLHKPFKVHELQAAISELLKRE